VLWGKRRQESPLPDGLGLREAQSQNDRTDAGTALSADALGNSVEMLAPSGADVAAESLPGGFSAIVPKSNLSSNGIGASSLPGAPGIQPEAPPLSTDEVRFSVAFARIISILLRSSPYRHMALNDLEWMVLPAVMTGQFAVMETQVNGQSVPVAVALWASVSKDVDQRLSDPAIPVIRLRPDEWLGGDIPWLIDVIGDGHFIPQLLQQLHEGVFVGRDVKMRGAGPNGNPTTGLLSRLITSGTH
jgi:hemolysin-activating ACP:hemolysin acyltransferase